MIYWCFIRKINNRLAFSYNPNDHYKKSFVFTLRPEEYYDDENHHDPFLEALNPEKILYCICFAKKDFFETVSLKSLIIESLKIKILIILKSLKSN